MADPNLYPNDVELRYSRVVNERGEMKAGNCVYGITCQTFPLLTEAHHEFLRVTNDFFLKPSFVDHNPPSLTIIGLFYKHTPTPYRQQGLGFTLKTTKTRPTQTQITYPVLHPDYLSVIRMLVMGMVELHKEGLCIKGRFDQHDIVFVGESPKYKAMEVVLRDEVGMVQDYVHLTNMIKLMLPLPPRTMQWPADLEDFFETTRLPRLRKFEGLLPFHCGIASPLMKTNFLLLTQINLGFHLTPAIFYANIEVQISEKNLLEWHTTLDDKRNSGTLNLRMDEIFKRKGGSYKEKIMDLYRYLGNCIKHMREVPCGNIGVKKEKEIEAFISNVFPLAISVLQRALFVEATDLFYHYMNLDKDPKP